MIKTRESYNSPLLLKLLCTTVFCCGASTCFSLAPPTALLGIGGRTQTPKGGRSAPLGLRVSEDARPSRGGNSDVAASWSSAAPLRRLCLIILADCLRVDLRLNTRLSPPPPPPRSPSSPSSSSSGSGETIGEGGVKLGGSSSIKFKSSKNDGSRWSGR